MDVKLACKSNVDKLDLTKVSLGMSSEHMDLFTSRCAEVIWCRSMTEGFERWLGDQEDIPARSLEDFVQYNIEHKVIDSAWSFIDNRTRHCHLTLKTLKIVNSA